MRFLSASPWPAQFLGLPVGLGPDHRGLALGPGPDGLGPLLAVRPQVRRLALALRAHALVDGLAVGGRQIHAGQAHVDHLDAEALGLPVHVLLDAVHQAAAIGAHDGIARRAGQDVAHRRVGEAGQALIGERDVAHGLIELQRDR